MKIIWKNIDNTEFNIINNWCSNQDKINLCMTKKDWQQTASDIEDCLKYMQNAQFKNIIGYINNQPVVALMFGIEHTQTLNLYNIIVNPLYRNLGIAKNVVLQLLNNNKLLNILEQYNKMQVSTTPNNLSMHKLLTNLGFSNLGFNGEYVVFEKGIINENEKTN